ncbi:hypothetical protein cypCar_00032108 [Cyprinus carpio]|nr:hypothetical protein cypCar_00032108 [Cyprinus carpio]
MPANAEEAKECAWQSPCVHDEDSGLCLVRLPALQALLYHCQFFESVGQMVKSFYTGRHAFTLSPPPLPANVTQQYENIPFQDPLKKMTAKALMSLLTYSSSTQSYACKAGVVDSCVERMKHIYVELHLESVKTGKSTHRRKVTEGFSNMIDSFNIRNTEYLLRGR